MTIADSIVQYESLRTLLLGTELGITTTLPARVVTSAADFDALVTSANVILRETLADDTAFLVGAGLLKRHEATRSLYLLRTARQHKENEEAIRFYGSWIGSDPVDWTSAAERLMAQIQDLLQNLLDAAKEVRGSSSLRQQWVESAAVSVSSIFDAVCHDLQRSFRTPVRATKIRAIEARYRREQHTNSKGRIIADLCVQEILAENSTLPVSHSEILDELGLLGTHEAAAALALAYTTARALPGLAGEDFSQKVSTMWRSLVGT